MTDQPGKDGAVNRLLDMVVEEVSLVDRAANNRQFLIVKRDQSMDEDIDTEKADTGDNTDAEAGELVADGSPLSAAIAALESLTSIVEVLGSLGANRADTRLAELARELRDTADQILTSVDESGEEQTADATDNMSGEGAETADSGVELRAKAKAKPAKPPPKPPRKPPAKAPKKPPGKDDLATELDDEEEPDEEAAAKTAKSALANLAKLMEGLTSSSSDSHRTAPAKSNDGVDFATTLKRLADSVQSLTQTIQEQQQRLGRVEKQFGLPNSAGEPETTAKSADEIIGWPLDLNHPMDRQSVDKAVSFHD